MEDVKLDLSQDLYLFILVLGAGSAVLQTLRVGRW